MTEQEKILFIKNFNQELKKIQQQILKRAKKLHTTAETRKVRKDPFTTDYEIEATVEYYLPDWHDPVHTCNKRLSDGGKDSLLDDQTDWRTCDSWPDIGEPYCYLLHDLFDHTDPHMRYNIYNIDRIWIDVTFTDQKALQMNPDGTCRQLFWSAEEHDFI